jgi:hypothetical protein
MKKLLFVWALTVVLLPFAPPAKSQDVSIDFFYNNLNGGSWFEVGNYGYCWQPDIAVSDPSWRPYADGYWAYTDLGWTWVSYEDYGWATYHYGRWVRLADYGWVWRPGYEWGPAWVSWRFGGGYAGWAPLPPETEVVYESRPLTGQIDVEFDIGPAYYNFVDVRYIGEPVLRSRIVDVNQNVTYINQTVNVTNITYKNNTVYNYGPDLTVVNQYSSRPIQKLKLERQANVDFTAAAKSGGLTKVQGNALVVAAPMKINKSAKQLAPPTVKAKVAEPKIEKGWSGVDPNTEAQIKQKIKTENPKNIPPPTAGGNAAAAGASASVLPSASLAPGTAPVEKSKKGKAGEQVQSGAVTSPITSPSVATSPSIAPAYGKPGKGRRGEQFGGPSPAAAPSAGAEGITKPEGKRKGFERQNVGPTPGAAGSPGENFNQPRGKPKQFEQQQPGRSPAGATSPDENFNQPGGKHNKRVEGPGMSPSGQEGGAPGAQGGRGEGPGKHKAEGVTARAAQPAGGAQMPAGPPSEPKHDGKGKGATPTPGPQ